MKATETTTEFKKVLMYTDELKKINAINKYNTSLEQLNNFIAECEILIERKFTKKEILSATKNPLQFSENIKEIIIDTFQFPKATLEFNLDSMGLSFSKIEIAVKNITPTKYKFIIEKGRVVPDPTELELIEEQSKVYTTNQRQTDVYFLAKELKNIADKLAEMKITNSTTKFNYQRATSQLIQLDTTNQLKINYPKLQMIV